MRGQNLLLSSSPGKTQPKSGEGKTAGNITWTEAESPAGRVKSHPPSARKNQFGLLQLNSRGAGVKARLSAAPSHRIRFTATLLLLLLLLLSSKRQENSAK